MYADDSLIILVVLLRLMPLDIWTAHYHHHWDASRVLFGTLSEGFRSAHQDTLQTRRLPKLILQPLFLLLFAVNSRILGAKQHLIRRLLVNRPIVLIPPSLFRISLCFVTLEFIFDIL